MFIESRTRLEWMLFRSLQTITRVGKGLETGVGWVHIVSNPDLPFLFGMGSGFEAGIHIVDSETSQ